MGANARSTVGTVTDANAMLRVLFSRLGYAVHRAADGVLVQRAHPQGERRDVDREGRRPGREERRPAGDLPRRHVRRVRGPRHRSPTSTSPLIVDESKSLVEGAILVPGYTADGWMVAPYKVVVPPDVPIKELTEAQRDDLLYGRPAR